MVVTNPESNGRRRVIHKYAADVCKSWKQILDDLSGFRIQPQYAIAEFASRPCLAVLVCRHVVGPRFGSRCHPLLETFGFRFEHSDPVRTVLTEPQAPTRIQHSAARRRGGSWRWVHSNLSRFCIDVADVATAEHGEINIVLRVRNDIIDIRPGDAERLKNFELAGFLVEAQHCVRSGVLQPHFAVHFMMVGTDLIDLYVIAVQLRRKAPRLEFFRLLIEFSHATLELHPEPDVFVFVKTNGQAACRQVRFQTRNLVIGHFARLRIQFSKDHFSETGVPRESLRVHNHIVRLSRLLRKLVFGVDDFGCSSLRPWKCLKGVAPFRPSTYPRRNGSARFAPGYGNAYNFEWKPSAVQYPESSRATLNLRAARQGH